MKPGGKLKIVGLGDSTTAGTPGFMSPIEEPPQGRGNWESQYAYWMMKAHPGWEVLNRGVNGERTDQIAARFERDVVGEKPSIVVILGGVNDVYQGLPVAEPQGNLARMYRMAVGAGVRPVGCSVLPYNSMGRGEARARRELNAWIREECGRLSMPFCDTSLAVADSRNPDRLSSSPDGLHPDVDGYRAMAQAITSVVESQLVR